MGIGDVLVAETKQQAQERVCSALISLHKLIDELPLDDLDTSKARDDTRWQLVHCYVNQLLRILDPAKQYACNDVIDRCCWNLMWLLRNLAICDKNEKSVQYVLDVLHSSLLQGLRFQQHHTVMALSEWPFVVFRNPNVKFLYWNRIFSGTLLTLWALVQKDQLGVYIRLLEFLEQSFIDAFWPISEIWQVGHCFLNNNMEIYDALDSEFHLESVLNHLASESLVWSDAELCQWLDKFEKICAEIRLVLPEQLREEWLVNYGDVVSKVERWHLRCAMVELLFTLNVSCMKNDKLEFVRALLELKQKPGSMMISVAADLLPANELELFHLFFRNPVMDRAYIWNIDDAVNTINDQFKTLLAYYAQLIRNPSGVTYFRIPVDELNQACLINADRQLQQIAKTLNMITSPDCLKRLNLENVLSELNVEKVRSMLIQGKTGARRELHRRILSTELSEKLKQPLFKAARRSFRTTFSFRQILQRLCRTSQLAHRDDLPQISRTMLPNEMFFYRDKRHLIEQSGNLCGTRLANRLQAETLKTLINRCSAIDFAQISDAIVPLSTFLFMNASDSTVAKARFGSRKNTPYNNFLFSDCPDSQDSLWIGGQHIPMFGINSNALKGKMLILNRFKLPRLLDSSSEHGEELSLNLVSLFQSQEEMEIAKTTYPDLVEEDLHSQSVLVAMYRFELAFDSEFCGFVCTIPTAV